MIRLLFIFVVLSPNFVFSQKEDANLDSLLGFSHSYDKEKQMQAYLDLAEYYLLKDSAKVENYLAKVNPRKEEFPDSTRRNILYEKVEVLKKANRLQSAISILRKELKLAEQENDLAEQANIHKELSSCYFFGFDLDSTRIEVELAAEQFLELEDSLNYGIMLLKIGNIYYIKGDYEQAIEYGIDAKNVFIDIGHDKQLAVSFLHVGNIFFLLKDYKNAGDFYKRAYSYFDKIGDSLGKARTLLNHGLIYIQTDQAEVAIELYSQALSIVQKEGKLSDLSLLYNFLAEAYLDIQQYDSTRLYIAKSKDIDRKIENRIGLSQNNLLQAHMYFELEEVDSAQLSAHKALDFLEGIDSKEREKMIYELLYKIYGKKNDFEKAYKYMAKFMEVSDSLRLDESLVRKKAMDERAKLEAANYELKLLNQKKNLILKENKTQKIYMTGISIVAIFAIILVFMLTRSNRKNKELNTTLLAKQDKIEEDLKVKESLLKEIHHRVKNNLQIISSMLSIQGQYVNDSSLGEVISECKNRISSMSLIHENLYKTEDMYEEFFSSYVKKLTLQLMETYRLDETQIKLDMNMEDFYLGLDDAVPAGLLINEIFSNSVKHAFPNRQAGTIKIKLGKDENMISLYISDNGIGMGKDVNLDQAETFGLLLISLLASQLNAKVEVKAEHGTEYKISWFQKEEELRAAV